MKRLMRASLNYLRHLNIFVLLTAAGLGSFSVLLLYSMVENEIRNVGERYYKMQLYMLIAGVVIALIVAGMDYHFIAKLFPLYAGASLILCLLLFTPMVVMRSGTDDRAWLDFGFTTVQPSEFLKVAFILTFSLHLSKIGKRMNEPLHLILLFIHGAIPTGLVVILGDEGTALVFLFTFLLMIFGAGLWWRYIVVGLAAIPPVFWAAWTYFMKPHQKIRFQIIFDEALREQELQKTFHQQNSSLISMGTGGMYGKGLFGGTYNSVAEVQNDFLFSYIGMTLGFVGCVATILVLALLALETMRVALRAKDELGRNICIGVFAVIFFHSAVNIGMVLAVFPVIGIPLPFLSSGGTSVITLFIDIGLVLSVYSHREKQYHMFYD
ncbi:rod shape-determining protein RodA [Clostridia bacterium]|nr:rod shape-determining protein RodA [Clostridia bacterium]